MRRIFEPVTVKASSLTVSLAGDGVGAVWARLSETSNPTKDKVVTESQENDGFIGERGKKQTAEADE
jgi:hypothetical protein